MVEMNYEYVKNINDNCCEEANNKEMSGCNNCPYLKNNLLCIFAQIIRDGKRIDCCKDLIN